MRNKDKAREKKAAAASNPQRNAPLGAAMLSEAAWTETARSLKLSARELEMTRGVFDNLTEGAIAAQAGMRELQLVLQTRRWD